VITFISSHVLSLLSLWWDEWWTVYASINIMIPHKRMIIIMVISSHLIAWLFPSLSNDGTDVTALFTIFIIIIIIIIIMIIIIMYEIECWLPMLSTFMIESTTPYSSYVIYDFSCLSFFTSLLLFWISCRLAGQIHSLNSHYLMDLPPPLSCPSII